MSQERDEQLSENLLALLGEADFVRLVEWRGGTRLYVQLLDISPIAAAIGDAAAQKLARAYGGARLRVPLARGLRARRMREAGLANAEIALRLGITESGVERLFKRSPVKIVRRRVADPRQTSLLDLLD